MVYFIYYKKEELHSKSVAIFRPQELK